MGLIEQEGTYRGNVLDHSVCLSTNSFPQLVLSLQGVEIYDTETESWHDWSDVPENELIAYLILVDSKNQRTLNYEQIQLALGWDGNSFSGLEELDLSEVKIQFRVEPNTYDGKTTLQVSWIDGYDAIPGRTLRKLDAQGLKSLDAQFKNILKSKTKPATAASTKGKPAASGVVCSSVFPGATSSTAAFHDSASC